VATLIDGALSAGLHRAQWNAAGMPSGIYLYRLTTETKSAVKRMMLLK